MPVHRIGMVVHEGRTTAVDTARSVHEWAGDRGVSCTQIDVWSKGPRRAGRAEAHAAGDPDLVVTLGGDGTFLRGARIAVKTGAGVLGVDLGKVGFLTEVPAAEVCAALDAVHCDSAFVEERMTLTMRTSRRLAVPEQMESFLCAGRAPVVAPPPMRQDGEGEQDTDQDEGHGIPLDINAVNDIVLEKLTRDRQVSAGVYVAGRLLASYSADAFAVATPTGSTAYSFAAGGPILSPHMDALVFTPIAPHMTFNRSVVAAPDEPVALRVLPNSGPAAVSVDGQIRGLLDPGDWIAVYRAEQRVRLIRMGPTDFYGRLRDRFRLTDAPATAIEGEVSPFFGALPGAWVAADETGS